MQQHPVPQNITGFEFKLVGFLTLKQFAYLAGASIICFTFYLAVPGIFKWLFILPVAGVGLALAFLPIQGMSFDRWVVCFYQLMSKPHQRVWRKEPKLLSFLDPTFSYYLRRPPSKVTLQTSDKSRLNDFIAQLRREPPPDKLDALEKTRLGQLNFTQGTSSAPETGAQEGGVP